MFDQPNSRSYNRSARKTSGQSLLDPRGAVAEKQELMSAPGSLSIKKLAGESAAAYKRRLKLMRMKRTQTKFAGQPNFGGLLAGGNASPLSIL